MVFADHMLVSPRRRRVAQSQIKRGTDARSPKNLVRFAADFAGLQRRGKRERDREGYCRLDVGQTGEGDECRPSVDHTAPKMDKGLRQMT